MLRDIHQIQNAPPFGPTAVGGLLAIEGMLRDAVVHVPYCKRHLKVWSSPFAQIILEAASHIDSIWKAAETLASPATASSKSSLKNHYVRFGSLVAAQHAVFFGGEQPVTISPFRLWKKKTFMSPAWWDAYNALKHDRFSNQTQATLDHAVNAVAALLLAITYSGVCDLAILSASLLDTSSGRNPWAYNTSGKLIRDITWECYATVETELFAHPLGVFGAKDCNLSNYWIGKSIRFNAWWATNASKHTRKKGR